MLHLPPLHVTSALPLLWVVSSTSRYLLLVNECLLLVCVCVGEGGVGFLVFNLTMFEDLGSSGL